MVRLKNYVAGIHRSFTEVKGRLTVLFTLTGGQLHVKATTPHRPRRLAVTSLERDNPKDRDRFEDLAPEANDTTQEMSRLLESRRWEVQEGPFRGFGSPPGRF